jgi:hypothetical protein
MSENQASIRVISEGTDYELLAADDRTCFILRSKADFSAARLQGEDAARFRTDYDAIKQQYPTWKPDQTLAQLWDQGGYGWLAAQEAD